MIASTTTTITTSSSSTGPSTVIVSQLQGIVDAWETQNYPKVITLSHALLKRKKTIGDLDLTLPLQRLVLQAYLQQEDWDGLLKEAASSSFVVATVNQQEDIQDLILYAKYRKRDYQSVIDELTVNTTNKNIYDNDNDNNNDTTTTTTTSSLSVLKQHLLAQSLYQLQLNLQHCSYPTIQSTYQPIIDSINDINDINSSSTTTATITTTTRISKLDLLTNQIATMISLQVIPMVRSTTGNQGEEQQSNIIQQAIEILQNNDNDNYDDDGKTDLALNVGLYQTLTATTTTTNHHDYLQLARDINQDDANNDVIDTALTWKRHFWYRNDNDNNTDDSNNNDRNDNIHNGKTIHYNYFSNPKNNSPFSSLTVPQSVAQFNQTLLLLDGSNKNRSVYKVPSQPHPKWNRIQIQLYWYNRALLQFQNEQYVECIESCHSLRKVTTTNNTNSNSNTISTATTNNTASKKKKKNKPTTTTTTNITTTTGTTTFANTELSPDQAWWQARIDVLLAHVLHAQSKPAEAMQLLQQRLEQLKQQQQQQQQQSGSTSSFTIDHAIAHVQLHQYVLGNNNNNKINNNNNNKSLSSMKQLLETLPESIRSCPAVQWTLEEIKTKIVEQSYTINNNINYENSSSTNQKPQTTTLQQANILFEQGQYEKACTLYNQTLTSDNNDNNDDDEEEEVMDAKLRYIQALVLTGQMEESLQLAKSLPLMNNDDDDDTGFLQMEKHWNKRPCLGPTSVPVLLLLLTKRWVSMAK
ncbi:hypothetical protein IV203_030662 [Nitzschia inconspicua]|uniref:Uncharacterized protein n=1 Tax=Nitzschia inconspicua TaxID=303405 RepID=A0A9K3Q4E0_9STRA|nr:hypothetical protein IV203_030662 [Nitzschia inconspicua]